MALEFRLLSFTAGDAKAAAAEEPDTSSGSDQGNSNPEAFSVQMFGLNSEGDTVSITATGYTPFFYAKVPDGWGRSQATMLEAQLKKSMGRGYADSVHATILVERKKLYGFDGGKTYSFVRVHFTSERGMKRAKGCWYDKSRPDSEPVLKNEGYIVDGDSTYLYEAQIPPLLRMFHIQELSPSGWVRLPKSAKPTRPRSTTCTYEYTIPYREIQPLPDKEDAVPYKICSFDIEASSSHGDFPLAKKTYKKLATNIVDIWQEFAGDDRALCDMVMTAFGFSVERPYAWLNEIDEVYPRDSISEADLAAVVSQWIRRPMARADGSTEGDEPDDEEFVGEQSQNRLSFGKAGAMVYKGGHTVHGALEEGLGREVLIAGITRSLDDALPRLKGDEVTFIGSTFMRYGESRPYLSHCAVRGTCDAVPGAELQFCDTERDTLLAWTDVIQRENPDIIIGYNIFGFDYSFMYDRCEELGCEKQFLGLSRNRGECCASYNWKTQQTGLKETSIFIASGQHDLRFAEIPGRVQVDLYNYLRRDYQLTQYKLDYVASHFIGDSVVGLEYPGDGTTTVRSSNLVGLEEHSYICFEEMAHSSEMYKDGQKFEVLSIDREAGAFVIQGEERPKILAKKVRWGLAKDDVTPQDIFRMTNGGSADRAKIAKYCIQDCNLVQQLMRKIDVLTGFIEMASLCSVPLDYLVMRGQGIKLTSYIAKKCREKGTLMPVIPKAASDEAYEGAIVLDPKCGLYLKEPVACVDYSSLYPSSMISENISHDTKVWTKEYDLDGQLIEETGETDASGAFVYDNLPDYKYVDITYDTYRWQRKAKSAAMEKVRVGTKTCRFAQFPEGQHGIMPSVLKELLVARKATRKLIPKTTDPFMRNVLDKRQLSIKLTANSLYGGNGAKTSSFYEQDCAASTTAVGRKLLTYAKRVIEGAYSERVVTACGESVRIRAEYVYGDTDSVFFKFNLRDMDNEVITGRKALMMTIELAKEAGKLATSFLKAPHDLEYEKTFYPWCLLSKKRYVGMLYEDDPDKCKRKSMGIVLKRRDNAPIVKDVYGGVIDVLMRDQDVRKAVDFMQGALKRLVAGEYGLDKLIITKSLRSGYKNPRQIAHKVLADRIGRRDPGNKPRPGDRIAFAYFQNPAKKALQGDRIETPEFIQSQGLKLNYEFYITNQLMKPLQQLFALVLEDLPGFRRIKGHTLRLWKRELTALRDQWPDPAQAKRKEETLRNKEVKRLLFAEHLRNAENRRLGNQAISSFFSAA